REILDGRGRELPHRGRRGVVVLGDVPADDRTGRDREPREGVREEPTHVGQRDGEGEEERPREVQVVRRLDDLVSEQGDELPALHGQAATDGNGGREVRLLQVELFGVAERVLIVD